MALNSKFTIGIYLPNKFNSNVKLTSPERGNPGVGGAQFLLFSLPFYFEKYISNGYNFIFFAECVESIDCPFPTIKVDSLESAASVAKESGCDLFIYRPAYDNDNLKYLKKIEEFKLKSIAWFHNTPYFLLKHLYRNPYIVRCVSVSRDQYEFLRDNPIIEKTELIFNAIDASIFPISFNQKKDKKVIFMGSLTPDKGFHLLARMWPRILKVHPDAKLIVIGSGKLYNNLQQLGDFGIADSSYENILKKYICDKNGNVLDSINFLGVLGHEKYSIMGKGCLGIPNHPYVRETFCLAAAEFQLCGTPVVTRNYGGVKDTVDNNNSGFLVSNLREMEDQIIKLLSNLNLSSEMGKKGRIFIEEKFSYEIIIHKWKDLFESALNGLPSSVIVDDLVSNSHINMIKERFRIIKKRIPILNYFPSSLFFIHSIQFVRLRVERLFY